MQGKFMIMSAEKVAKEIFKAVVKKKREIVLTPLGKLTVWINKFAPSFVDFMMSKVIKIT